MFFKTKLGPRWSKDFDKSCSELSGGWQMRAGGLVGPGLGPWPCSLPYQGWMAILYLDIYNFVGGVLAGIKVPKPPNEKLLNNFEHTLYFPRLARLPWREHCYRNRNFCFWMSLPTTWMQRQKDGLHPIWPKVQLGPLAVAWSCMVLL